MAADDPALNTKSITTPEHGNSVTVAIVFTPLQSCTTFLATLQSPNTLAKVYSGERGSLCKQSRASIEGTCIVIMNVDETCGKENCTSLIVEFTSVATRQHKAQDPARSMKPVVQRMLQAR